MRQVEIQVDPNNPNITSREIWFTDKNGLTYKYYDLNAGTPPARTASAFQGQLREIDDLNGNSIRVGTIFGSGPFFRDVTSSNGEDLHFVYGNDRNLQTIYVGTFSSSGQFISDGRAWTYTPLNVHNPDKTLLAAVEYPRVQDPSNPAIQTSLVYQYEYNSPDILQGHFANSDLTNSAIFRLLKTVDTIQRTYTNGAITANNSLGLITHSYYPNGQAFQTTNQDGSVQTYQYDTYANPYSSNKSGSTVVTDPNGNNTRYEYDTTGHLVRLTNPDRSTTLQTWDSGGRQLTQTDPYGVITVYVYSGSNPTVAADNVLLGNFTALLKGQFRGLSATDINSWSQPDIANHWQQLYAYDRKEDGTFKSEPVETDYTYKTSRWDQGRLRWSGAGFQRRCRKSDFLEDRINFRSQRC